MPPSKSQLLLAGAGHAHLALLKHGKPLRDAGLDMTVIAPGRHHYYSGMGPGMLSGKYRPEEIRFDVFAMARDAGARVVVDRVTRIDATARLVHLAGGDVLPYDILSCNLGSRIPDLPRPEPGAPSPAVHTVKPIEGLLAAREALLAQVTRTAPRESPRIVVAGGGPAGVEVAGGAWRLLRDAGVARPRVTLVAGRRMLPAFPEATRALAMASFQARDMAVVEGARARAVAAAGLELDTGEIREADMVFLALGVRPSPVFADSGLPVGEDGGLLTTRTLQSVAHPEILGGGDCITLEDFALHRVGVHAVRQNPILLHNVQALHAGTPLRRYEPSNTYLLLLNLGDDTAILHRWGLSHRGKRWMRLKDWIDRRFMRMYQE